MRGGTPLVQEGIPLAQDDIPLNQGGTILPACRLLQRLLQGSAAPPLPHQPLPQVPHFLPLQLTVLRPGRCLLPERHHLLLQALVVCPERLHVLLALIPLLLQLLGRRPCLPIQVVALSCERLHLTQQLPLPPLYSLVHIRLPPLYRLRRLPGQDVAPGRQRLHLPEGLVQGCVLPLPLLYHRMCLPCQEVALVRQSVQLPLRPTQLLP